MVKPKKALPVAEKIELGRQKDALIWMRAQAKMIQPDLPDDASVYQMASIIAGKISLKKRRVHHRRPCTCSIVDIGYKGVAQITLDKQCPHHKHIMGE